MKFYLMNGCGNRFIILDARDIAGFSFSETFIREIARQTSVDQVIACFSSQHADVYMRIANQNGSEVSACGNATRCVAWLLMNETGKTNCRLETRAGILKASRLEKYPDIITVNMGAPRLDWTEIPLSEAMNTHIIDIKTGPIDKPYLSQPGAVNMGNPHCIFFVPSVEEINIPALGPLIEGHMLFPEKTNVGFAEIRSQDCIRLRVWERDTGLTQACGTGACAALVAAHRRKLAGREARFILDGGDLHIQWEEQTGHVFMTGPITLEEQGEYRQAQEEKG